MSWVKFGQGWVVKGCCLEIFCTPDVFFVELEHDDFKKELPFLGDGVQIFGVVFRSITCLVSNKTNEYIVS